MKLTLGDNNQEGGGKKLLVKKQTNNQYFVLEIHTTKKTKPKVFSSISMIN